MPEVEITICDRKFQVHCQSGEESFLQAAAALLDAEARPLMTQIGRMPDSRMLLMAGLMLADRTATLEDDLRATRARLADLEQREPPAPVRIEVPVIPPQVAETLAEIAARTEALAARLDETRP